MTQPTPCCIWHLKYRQVSLVRYEKQMEDEHGYVHNKKYFSCFYHPFDEIAPIYCPKCKRKGRHMRYLTKCSHDEHSPVVNRVIVELAEAVREWELHENEDSHDEPNEVFSFCCSKHFGVDYLVPLQNKFGDSLGAWCILCQTWCRTLCPSCGNSTPPANSSCSSTKDDSLI